MPQCRKAARRESKSQDSYGTRGRKYIMKRWIVAIAGLCCASGVLHAQVDDPGANFGITPTRSEWSGVYSAAQAQRGEQWYLLDECGSCHEDAGAASGVALLVGADFLEDWNGQSALDLARHIHSGPMGNPGDIRIAEATDLIAFILRENEIPAGSSDLPADRHVLARIRMDAQNPAAK
jgi:mono/diheme cytochrome c family protein